MFKYFVLGISVLLIGAALACNSMNSSATVEPVPEGTPKAVARTQTTDARGQQTAVFAGGCFWGVEAVFEHVKGVSDVRSGYAGGSAKNAKYEAVGTGSTGHAESVEVVFDPAVVSYKELLKVYFAVAHDPTELNRQGPDEGTQYRSAIFFASEEQKAAAQAYIDELTAAKTYSSPIVTKLEALDKFYAAEGYHQNYLVLHPDEAYIRINDIPKVEDLKKKFPEMYVEREGQYKVKN
jgi:peptide-methionine (S)-S-oxide reductase